MSDVFISYAREDRGHAEQLAREFERQGWTVWWDKVIPPGGKITYTQSSVSLENLIGQMMFSAPGPKKEGDAPQPAPSK